MRATQSVGMVASSGIEKALVGRRLLRSAVHIDSSLKIALRLWHRELQGNYTYAFESTYLVLAGPFLREPIYIGELCLG